MFPKYNGFKFKGKNTFGIKLVNFILRVIPGKGYDIHLETFLIFNVSN